MKFVVRFFLLSIMGWGSIKADTLQTVIYKFHNSTFKANFTVEINDQYQSGILYYQRGKIHIRLRDGRIVASDHRKITVYDPATRVAGKQDKFPFGGLGWILKYPRKIMGNRAVLEPPNSRPYKKIVVAWNQNLFPTLIQFIGERIKYTFRFSNIVFLKSISSSKFSYKPPAGSRTVENPLNLKK